MQTIQVCFDVNNKSLREEFLDKVFPETLPLLKESTKPVWGNFTAQHMVEHLTLTFEISNGKLEVPCTTPKEQVERMQKFLYVKRPIPREFKAPFMGEGLPELKYTSFDEVKSLLIKEIELFLSAYKNKSSKKITNPVFGLLDIEGWHRHHYKHCYHHLSQFKLIKSEE